MLLKIVSAFWSQIWPTVTITFTFSKKNTVSITILISICNSITFTIVIEQLWLTFLFRHSNLFLNGQESHWSLSYRKRRRASTRPRCSSWRASTRRARSRSRRCSARTSCWQRRWVKFVFLFNFFFSVINTN